MRPDARDKIADPGGSYSAPSQVLEDKALTVEDKVRVLNAFVLDAKLMSTVTSDQADNQGAARLLQAATKALETLQDGPKAAADDGRGRVSFRRILVALNTDDPLVDRVLETAREMAGQFEASIRFLTVVPPAVSNIPNVAYGPAGAAALLPDPLEQSSAQLVEHHRKNADRLLANFAPLGDGRHAIRRGICDDEIVRYAAEWPADLLIMGSHKHGWLSGLFRDSTTQAVINRIGCAVLLVSEAG